MTIIHSRGSTAFSDTSSGMSSRVFVIPGSRERIFITENASSWTGPVKKRLEDLIQLPDGWDGYKGVHVTFENANFAFRVLDAICGSETRMPQIVPGTLGDLQLEWHTLQGDLEIHIKGPNNVHAWRAMAGGDPDGENLDLTVDFSIVAQWVKEISERPIATATAA
jgi:hypothetical protein